MVCVCGIRSDISHSCVGFDLLYCGTFWFIVLFQKSENATFSYHLYKIVFCLEAPLKR